MDRRLEVTEETLPMMLHETTHVALQAAAAYSNGWTAAARGFLQDMSDTWGSRGMVRMVYVWGSAKYFLPRPDGLPAAPGYQKMTELAEKAYGEKPAPEDVSRLVAQADQVAAASKAVAEAASKGDVERLTEIVNDYGGDDQARMNSLLFALMAEAGIHLRYSRDTEAQMSYDLFMAHVNADLLDDDDEEEGDSDAEGGSDDGPDARESA
ncbi:hypothetical protein [Streptomyces longwoodensis]|uniref:hypothetical protein n=1 Tax=Streptomyces longwoodensis TaxID=68231 RepID=UPI0036F9B187